MSLEFLITSLIVVLIPGTGVIYTVSNGLFVGWRPSIAAAVGCTGGIIPHLIGSVLGLSALLHMSALLFNMVKCFGVCYLLYLAWGLWRDNGSLSFKAPERSNYLKISIKGVLINILNPKLSIFFLAFLPQFVPLEASSPLYEMVVLSAVFMGMTFLVFVVYGVCAGLLSHSVKRSPRIVQFFQRLFAMTFAALAIRLALSGRE